MNLSAYPRPPGDTGLGIHWSAGPAGAVPMQDLRQRWLPELRAMDIKWVKCLHDGAEGLVQELLANDIMPIVRLYRHQPNPGRLDQELKNRVKRLVDLGVRYFEVNNEPNLKEEWQPGEWENVGDQLPNVVVDHWIADAEYVLAEGGLPAFPAPTPGGHWDDVDFFVKALRVVGERGRDDLFEEGAWLAIHNYFLNHPPDYPYDEVNQFGVPVSNEVTQNHDFRRPIPEVNQGRQNAAVPGRTLAGDSNGFLKYRLYHDLFVEHFGFEVPLLTTEGGVVMNRAQDPRYPVIDQQLHRAYNLFGFTHMVDAPNAYFCNCPWLIANAQMNHHNEHWEDNAWYSDRWQGGHLPIVTAVKERSPWPVRRFDGPAGTLNVTVEDGAGQVVVVRRSPGGTFVADGDIDQQNDAEIGGLRAGTYTAGVIGTSEESAPVTLSEGGTASISMEVPPRMSAIVGQVANPPDDAVAQLFVLDSSGDAKLRRQIPVSGGHFRFDGLSAGRYRIGLANRPGVTAGPVELDGRDTEHVTLSVPRQEWEFTVVENTSGDSSTQDRRSIVHLIAPALHGRTIQLHAPWAVISENIGNKPEINPDAAIIDSLPAGTYRITVQGIPGEIEFSLDGRGTARIRLAQTEVPVEADTSRIVGQLTEVPSSADLPTAVRLIRSGTQVAETQTDPTGKFVFEGLAAGTYVIRVPAFKLQSTSFTLDGKNEISFNLQVPPQAPPAQSRIRAVLRNAPSLPADVILLRDGSQVAQTRTDTEGIFVFEELPAGTYVVRVPAFDLESTPVTLDGTTEERFQLRVPEEEPAPPEEPPQEPGPPDEPTAAMSTIRGHIIGTVGQPVTVELDSDGVVITEMQTTASGEFVFRSLPAGAYTVHVPAFDVSSDRIELDGTNDESVRLRVQTPSPGAGSPEPALQTYIWLIPGQLDIASLYLLTLPLIEKTGWTFGRSRTAAQRAGSVIVVGGAQPANTDDIAVRTSIVNKDPLILAAELASFEVTV